MSNSFEHDLRERLLDERPPADLTIDPAEVIWLGEQELRRRRGRIGKVVLGGAAAALVAASVAGGIALSDRNNTSASSDAAAGQADMSTAYGSAAAGAGSAATQQQAIPGGVQKNTVVTLADGQQRLVDLIIRESSPEQLSLQLKLSDQDGAPVTSKTVTAPGAGSVAVGEVDGMPFYVVRGQVTQAMVSFGPTLEDQSVRTTQLIDSGGFTVLWPDQKGLRQTARQPIGVVWTTDDKVPRARTLPGTYPDLDRMFVDVPGGGQALLSKDSTSVQLETVTGVIRKPITNPLTLVSAGELDLAGLAFGVGNPGSPTVSGFQQVLTTTDSGMFALGVANIQRDATISPPDQPSAAPTTYPPSGVSPTVLDISVTSGGVTRTVKVPAGYTYAGVPK